MKIPLYRFEKPTRDNVHVGDLLFSRDTNGLRTEGLVPIDEVKEDKVFARGACVACIESYETAIVYTQKGKLLVGERIQKQITRDLAFLLSRSSLSEIASS